MRARRTNIAARRQRQLIIDSAARLFRQAGYHSVTVEQIAQSLHLSKVTIYYYWSSKLDILYEIQSTAHKAVLDRMKAIVASSSPADIKLREAIVMHIREVSDETSPSTLALRDRDVMSGKRRKAIIKMRDEYDGLWRQIIRDGVDQGVFVDCDPKLTSLAILGALNYLPQWYSREGPLSTEEIAEYFARYLAGGILAPNRNQV